MEATLGVHCSLNGDMTHQIKRMEEQSQDWADKIKAGHMDRTNVAIILKTTIWKTLGYPLSATLFKKEEYEKIMQPTLQEAIPKMGLNRTFPRKVIFSLCKFQGLKIPHIFTMQSIQHLKAIINHQLNPNLTKELYNSTFESL